MPHTLISSFFLILLLVLGNTLLITSSYANDHILVFSDSNHPINHTSQSVSVIYLDRPNQIEHILSEGLSNDPIQAKYQAISKIQNNKQLQDELIQAYIGLSKAWQLGITKIPAIVINEHFILYGISDVSKAIQLVESHNNLAKE